jgi:hypothetical protein
VRIGWRRPLLAVGLPISLLTASAALAAGRLGGGEDLGISLWRIVWALLISITVAFLAILLIRQRSGKLDLPSFLARIQMRERAIEVVETRRLSPHADICLVRHGSREYLLLLMAGNARVLSERDHVPEPGPTAEPR